MKPFFENSFEKAFTVLLILVVPALLVMLLVGQA